MIAIRINTNIPGIQAKMRKIPKRLSRNLSIAQFNVAKEMRDGIRKQFILQKRRSPRGPSSRLIRARKKSKFTSVVTLPLKLHYLDSMRPHWVALKRGRAVTKWAKRYYGNMVKSGKSRVFRGEKGGILFGPKRKSFLWVTPDPFVNRGIEKSNRKASRELRRAVKKSLIGG